MWSNLKPIDINKINPIDFPDNQYYPLEYTKKQIVLHHTVSGEGVRGDISHWLSTTDRISTPIIVDYDGVANQCFSSRYWGHHLGIKSSFLKNKGFNDWTTRNIILNRESIALEIDNWGALILGDGTLKKFGEKNIKTIKGKYYAAYGNIVDVDVVYYPNGYRGYNYFHKYSNEQIKTVGELLLYWNKYYKIPLDYNENMWEVNNDALSGKHGIWSHSSYREDKTDIHPQPELIEMLKSLKK